MSPSRYFTRSDQEPSEFERARATRILATGRDYNIIISHATRKSLRFYNPKRPLRTRYVPTG